MSMPLVSKIVCA